MMNEFWTNNLDDQTNKALSMKQETRIFQAELRADILTSMHLELDANLAFNRIINTLPKMTNLTAASVKTFASTDPSHAKQVFDVLATISASTKLLKTFEVEIANRNPVNIISQIPSSLLTALSIGINFAQIESTNNNNKNKTINPVKLPLKPVSLAELTTKSLSNNDKKDNNDNNTPIKNEPTLLILKSIESLTNMNSLTLRLDYNQAQKPDMEFAVFLDHIRPHLTKIITLSLQFSQDSILSDKEMSHLGGELGIFPQIKNLSIQFESTKAVTESGMNAFLKELTRNSKLNLDLFSLSAIVEFSEATYKQFGRFLNSQKNLTQLEFNDVKINQKLIDAFIESQSSVKKRLKSIHYEIERDNNIRNGGLQSIGDFLYSAKSTLEKVYIFFDYSHFSGESLSTFWNAIASMPNLSDLRLDFTGKVLDQNVKLIMESIVKCHALHYLFLRFSGSGEKNIVEWVGDTPTKTIFECERVEVIQKQKLRYRESKSGSLNQLFVDLAIAKQNKHIKHLTVYFPTFFKMPPWYKETFDSGIQELFNQVTNLKTFAITNKQMSVDDEDLVIEVLERNVSTIVNVLFESTLYDIILEVLEPAKDNLLSLRFLNASELLLPDKAIEMFPNLVSLDYTQTYYFNFSRIMQYDKQFLESYLTYFVPSTLAPTAQVEYVICQECFSIRRTTIQSIFIFDQIVRNILSFKPQFMVADLWLDL